MAAVALIGCFLYPFPKLVLENQLMKVAGGLKKRWFAIDPVGNNKIRGQFRYRILLYVEAIF